jgi:hypothetical protein
VNCPRGDTANPLRLSVVLTVLLGPAGSCRAPHQRTAAAPTPPLVTARADKGDAHPAVAPRTSPQDLSLIHADVGYAWLLVIDPHGKRTGLDLTSGEEITEIPESHVSEDFLDSMDPGDTTRIVPFNVEVSIDRAAEGTYRLIVGRAARDTAGGSCCFRATSATDTLGGLEVKNYAVDGSPQPVMSMSLDFRKARPIREHV